MNGSEFICYALSVRQSAGGSLEHREMQSRPLRSRERTRPRGARLVRLAQPQHVSSQFINPSAVSPLKLPAMLVISIVLGFVEGSKRMAYSVLSFPSGDI